MGSRNAHSWNWDIHVAAYAVLADPELALEAFNLLEMLMMVNDRDFNVYRFINCKCIVYRVVLKYIEPTRANSQNNAIDLFLCLAKANGYRHTKLKLEKIVKKI